MLREGERKPGVLLHQNDARAAFVADLRQGLEQGLDHDRRQPFERLVEQEHLGSADQRAAATAGRCREP